jgi:hypothetical protein
VPDVFVSYTTADLKLARYVHDYLRHHKVDAFLARVSLEGGTRWTPAIWAALMTSPWVLFLASEAACKAPYVQHEFGIALGAALAGPRKTLIPVVWDMDPGKLPGWMNQFTALDLRENLAAQIGPALDHLARRVQAGKQQGAVIFAAFVAGVLAIGHAQEQERKRARRRRRASR